MIKLSNEITTILDLVKINGYNIYLVGGFVRDSLLNKLSFDVDMTTNATPEILIDILKEYDIDKSFVSYGCIKFCVNKYNFEITTHRKETNYINHRRPLNIEFTNKLHEDLLRRDFTINALCYDGVEIIDLFGGINDLKHMIIKTIGNADYRLEEDALRVLRALRFSSKLSFNIDKNTKKSIITNYKYLKDISFENLYKELKGILDGDNYLNILREYKDVFKEVFLLSDLKVELFNLNMNYEEKEALFFYYSNIKINNKYLINKELIIENDKVDLKKKLNKYGYEKIYNILYFRSEVIKENNQILLLLKEIIENNECYNLKMLEVNGNDLLQIDVEKEKINKYLNILLEVVVENKCINDKKCLLNYLSNILI